MARFLSYANRDRLMAFSFATTIGLSARAAWWLANVVKDDPLHDALFAYYAGPCSMLIIALFGTSELAGTPRHTVQMWASLFLGVSAIVSLEVQMLLPGWWPILLTLPTAWWFVPFYRVKRDRWGAADAFLKNRAVRAIMTAIESARDRVEGPGWRDRREQWYAETEARILGRPGPLMEALEEHRQIVDAARRRKQAAHDAELAAEFGVDPAAGVDEAAASPQGGGNEHDPSDS